MNYTHYVAATRESLSLLPARYMEILFAVFRVLNIIHFMCISTHRNELDVTTSISMGHLNRFLSLLLNVSMHLKFHNSRTWLITYGGK